MEAEQVMKLFDAYWFEIEILKKQQPVSATIDQEIEEEPSKPEFFRIPSIHTRSMSEDLSSINCGSLSPDSVLHRPKLGTIVSGKESKESMDNLDFVVQEHEAETAKKAKIKRRRKKRDSKSLTDLQFEELKGFMDLGFVFSEQDKDSNLAAIIPGLKKLGKKDAEDGEKDEDTFNDEESVISRPYLSEAWEVMERRRTEKKSLVDWRFPALSNEIDMKDNLRWWAHSVASVVR